MKKWIPLFLFLVFEHDIAIDAFEDACEDQSQKTACHMCVCQSHFVQKNNSAVNIQVPSAGERVVTLDTVLSTSDFSRTLFHPPKILA